MNYLSQIWVMTRMALSVHRMVWDYHGKVREDTTRQAKTD